MGLSRPGGIRTIGGMIFQILRKAVSAFALVVASVAAQAGLPYEGVWYIQEQGEQLAALEGFSAALTMMPNDPADRARVRFFLKTPEGEMPVEWSPETGFFQLPVIPEAQRANTTVEHNLAPGSVRFDFHYGYRFGRSEALRESFSRYFEAVKPLFGRAQRIFDNLGRFFPHFEGVELYATGLRVPRDQPRPGETLRLMRGDTLVREFDLGVRGESVRLPFSDYDPEVHRFAANADGTIGTGWEIVFWSPEGDEAPPQGAIRLLPLE